MSTFITALENEKDYSNPENLVWQGYRRSDGRVGCRNHLVILSTVALTDRLAQEICANNELFVPVTGAFSRGLQHQDEKIIDAFINAVVFHPNVGGALILTHDRQYMETLKQIDKGKNMFAQVELLMSQLESLGTLAKSKSSWEQQKLRFRTEVRKIDGRRGEDFATTFPELARLIHEE